MATTRQNQDFAYSLDLLDQAIDWIKVNMDPDEVFPQAVLEDWAEENGYVKEE